MAKFKIGDEVISRDGKDKYDRVVIGYMSNGYVAYEYTSSTGRPILGYASEDCFVLKPTKKEGWVNVYPGFGSNLNTLGKVYATEADAKINADQGCLATTKIEWEE